MPSRIPVVTIFPVKKGMMFPRLPTTQGEFIIYMKKEIFGAKM